MAITCIQEQRTLTARLSGELDHHRAREVMEELERQIGAALPRLLVLDLGELSFTDSSGIAVLIRAQRQMQRLGGELRVKRVPEQAGKVFRAAGLERIIHFEP